MSIKQMSLVWELSKAEGSELLVALALADRADEDGYCFPGIQSLAKKCKLSDRSVQRCLRALCDIGELTILENEGVKVNGGHTNRYRITVGGDIHVTRGVVTPVSPGVVTSTSPGVVTPVSPNTSGKPSVNPSEYIRECENAPDLFDEKPSAHPLPSPLNTPQHTEAWEAFLQVRKAKRAPMTAPAKARIVHNLQAWGPAVALDAIWNSVTNGWTGIFEPKRQPPKPTTTPTKTPTDTKPMTREEKLIAAIGPKLAAQQLAREAANK